PLGARVHRSAARGARGRAVCRGVRPWRPWRGGDRDRSRRRTMTNELEPLLAEHLARHEDALNRIRDVLVTNLKVALPPEQIELDAPLFGTGLGLDSVNAVELVVAIEQEFDLRLAED